MSDLPEIALRAVTSADLDIFFVQQADPDACRMAAFTAKDPTDRQAFDLHWSKVLADPGVTIRTILYRGRVAGSVLVHSWMGDPEISYWIGREFWGKGIATQGLKLFLGEIRLRPLYAHAAADNLASIRVLEKNGFKITGRSRFFANARNAEIDEIIAELA